MTTSEPRRIQLSRVKGWRMPANTLKVDRATIWGNPFVIGERPDRLCATRWGWWPLPKPAFVPRDGATAVAEFKEMIERDRLAQAGVRKELRGKNLACWCAPGEPCHADVLLELANAPSAAEAK